LRYHSHHSEAIDNNPVTTDNPNDSGSRTMDAFSPSLGVDIPLSDDLNLFGSVSTVFNTPTTSELSNQATSPGGFNPNLDPTTGHSFEAGVRARLGALVAFEVAAYRTNLENELVAFQVEGSPGINYFRNAGESRHTGLEATLSAGSRGGFVRGDLSYTYTDARFLCRDVSTSAGCTDDEYTDKRIPGIAPRRIQAILRINPTLPVGGESFVELVATSMDDTATNDLNTAHAPAYEVVDLRLGLAGFDAGSLFLSPWLAVTNIFDEDYIASVAVNAAGSRFFEPGPPRSFQVGLRARWGTGE
jgi:iron complex outermembrane receptor protein